MKKSRIVSILMALVMTASLISGCGGGETESKAENNSSASGTANNSETGNTFEMDDDGQNVSNINGNGGTNGGSNQGGGNYDAPVISGPTDNINNDKDADKFPGRAKDLKGKTIKVESWNKYLSGNDPANPLLSQRQKTLLQSIEKTLNCKIEIVQTKAAGTGGDPQVLASVQSGKPSIDIWWFPADTLVTAYSAGLLTDLDKLKVIDFDDTSRYTGGTEMAKINGTHYAVAPKTYGLVSVYTNRVLFANLTLLKNCGITLDQLTQWQKSGQWTWDKFEEVAAKVAASTNAAYKKYAVSDSSGVFYQELMNANNCDWVSRDKNGNFTFTGAGASQKKVLERYTAWAQKKYIDFTAPDSLTEFKTGSVAFLPLYMFTPIYHKFNFDYTIMYPPKGPDAKGYLTATGDYTFAAIPKGKKPSGCTDAEIATVLDLLQTNLVNSKENSSLAATTMAAQMTNQLATDTVMGIYNQGAPQIMWPVLTSGVGMLGNGEGGWYNNVIKIAKGASQAQVIGSVEEKYNTLLKDIWKKK